MKATLIRLIGSGLGVGFLPTFPGTWGSLFASFVLTLPLWLIDDEFFATFIWLFIIGSALLHYLVAPAYLKRFGTDPPSFVLDEWVGQAIVFFAMVPLFDDTQLNFMLALLGFILFRVFDILKPLGIDKLQNRPGQLGVLLDDIAAGLVAYLCLKTLIFLVF